MKGMHARDELSPVSLSRQDYRNGLLFAPWHSGEALITRISNEQPPFRLVVDCNRVWRVSWRVYYLKAEAISLVLKLLAVLSIIAYFVLWHLHAKSTAQ